MTRMRIYYLASAGSIHVQRWVEYFASRGYDVHLISFSPPSTDIKNVKIHLLKKSKVIIKVVSNIIDSILAIYQIKRLLKKINPDIVHVHYIWEFGIAGVLIRFQPLLISVWGSEVLNIPQRSHVHKWIIGSALKKADKITTTAQFMGGYLQREFNLPEEKIVRIPWGVNLNIFYRGYQEEVTSLKEELGISKDSPVIISIRHMKPLYNVQSIIEAAYYVVQVYPHAAFIMLRGYGSSEFENEMKKKAESLGISQNVRFIPTLLTPEKMAVFLNAADIFVSIPKTDQFASSIMEGMACGAIPITSTIDVYTQYLQDGENAFFVDPNNPEELAERIMYCIEHLHTKEKIYNINRAIIEEEEDWSKNARKMEELYENLLQEG